ncbi:cell wall hydrolase [Parasphingopyxis algicola]|uniref:cell wall hydrolase n=1 Tax=Parasphingopyxis algicola TaxID=2026624 RepID=UPI0015A3A9CA|nr:cell wall hydrolase [Parasphingopyxis algicola]QLC26170.1 cell wall hydrolase [Parasphingopyxis algicola]
MSAMAAAAIAAVPMATGFAAGTGETAIAAEDDELLAEAGFDASLPDILAKPIEEPVIDLDALSEDVGSAEETTATEATDQDETTAAVAINDAHDDELECLVRTISNEARGEPRDGKLAVAQVVMNRVASPLFPDTICGVVYQRRQFSNIRRHQPNRSGPLWDRMVDIAIDARNGISEPMVGEALFFHARYVRPGFSRTRQRVAQIGGHIFYQ